MAWIALFTGLTLFSALGLTVSINRVRFEHRTGREIRALLSAAPLSHFSGDGAAPAPLPPSVVRYRALAVGARPPVRTLRLHHGGTFRMSLTGEPKLIHGAQTFTADPPGFLWTGRISLAPGLWVDARDESVSGVGGMRVLLDDTLTLADARGPALDQGSALRLLAEMPWYPTALFDAQSVAWSPIDAHHARATLRVHQIEVSGIFEFGADGLPVRMTAERFDDKGVLRGWGGLYRDFRLVSGMRVPFEAEVYWELPSGPCTYAHWHVDAMDYDEAVRPGG